VKLATKRRVLVIYNRDFEGAEADPENKAREDIKGIAENVVAILASRGFFADGLGVTSDVLGAVNAIRAFAPDVVFNLCESIGGDNRFEPLLPMLLDREGIAYTGSGPLTLSLSLHKHRAKDVLRARCVPTPEAVYLTTPEVGAVDLPFPLIVKPSREDASVGIYSESVVHDRAALERRVTFVLSRYRQAALVERFVEGREIYVSMLGARPGRGSRGADGEPEVLPFFEIDFSDMPAGRPRIVSFDGKWVEDSDEYRGTKPIPCREMPAELTARVARTAVAAFQAMELRDYGRMDIRLAEAGPDAGTPYVIDVNPNCDLSNEAGGFSKAARAAGLSYDDVILRIVELALQRRPHADTIPLAARSRSAHRDLPGGDLAVAAAAASATGAVGAAGAVGGRSVARDRAPRRRARSG
jgi:D-alanine-D-alanine ligase